MEQSSADSRQSGRSGTRQQTHEIVIDAPIEAVWKAIADAEELTRWFVEEAWVEPGVGGSIAISWGGDKSEPSRIEVWEPNQKLRLALAPLKMGKMQHEGTMVNEYTLERRDGKTVLRLVSSGIPDSPEWDGFYNGTDSGWRSFLRTLRHYLEHHRGKPRTTITVVGKLPGSLEDGWARLTGPAGLGFTPVAGESFSTQAGPAGAMHGNVVFVKEPGILELTVGELDDSYLAHSMAGAGGSQYVYTILSVYGKSRSEVDAIRAKWQPWLEGVLGLSPAATQ